MNVRTRLEQARRAWRSARRRTRDDLGQTAIVAVIALTVGIAATGAFLLNETVQSGSVQQQQAAQAYANRALEAAVNSYLTAINTNPSLAQCSSATNGSGTCGGLKYEVWNEVTGSGVNGADTEYYAFGNPQPTFASDGSLASLTVEVAGAAYDPTATNHYVFQTTTLTVTPSNGFLDNVWWTNYESYNSSGNYSQCNYNWSTSADNPSGGPDGNYDILGGSLGCSPVYFGPGDYLNGPIYSNDSLFVASGPSFGTSTNPSTVQTADPNCLFVNQSYGMDGSPANCSQANSSVSVYNTATSAYGHPLEVPPQDDTQLGTIAAQNGCLYSGPTQITLNHGNMTILSPDTPEKTVVVDGVSHQWDTNNLSSNLNNCPNNGTAAIPPNGVVFVQNATPGQTVAWANPFDDPVSNSTTNVTASPSAPSPSQPVTLTATVTSASPHLDTGATVSFSETTSQQVCYFWGWWCTTQTSTSVISGCSAQTLSTPVAVSPATTPATYEATATCSTTEASTGTGGFSATYSGNSTTTSSSGTLGHTSTLTPSTTYGPDAQVSAGGCGGCYYGATSQPDSEGDAFVNGNLSGELTIGTANDIVIDGSITYNDCSWESSPGAAAGSGTPSQSYCPFNPGGTNDTLGLIADKYVEVNHPVSPSSGNLLPACPSNSPGPLCNPADGTGNVTIDAAVLGLNQSFVVNNYTVGPPENELIVYGSIQQFARGPVGTFSSSGIVTGYVKHYTWDPLLDFLSPPSYLVPTMPSWQLGSSSGTVVSPTSGSCPTMPAPVGSGGSPTSSYCGSASGGLPNYA